MATRAGLPGALQWHRAAPFEATCLLPEQTFDRLHGCGHGEAAAAGMARLHHQTGRHEAILAKKGPKSGDEVQQEGWTRPRLQANRPVQPMETPDHEYC